MLTSQRRRWRWKIRSSRPPGLQPVGELSQRPLVVDHAEFPDVTPHLRLVLVGLAYVRICCNEDVIRGVKSRVRQSGRALKVPLQTY